MIEIELPFPPSVNHYYGRGRRGSVFITQAGRKYRQWVVSIVSEMGFPPFTTKLKMEVELYPPLDNCDIDNFQKCLQDSLQHAKAYNNDRQIKRLEIDFCDPIPGGRVLVRLSEKK